MRVHLHELVVHAKRSIERIAFSEFVTFIHGPVSTGKSTVARLVDYCFGGDLERTPAIQAEFLSAELLVTIGTHICSLERASSDKQSIRVSWTGADGAEESVNAPLDAQDTLLFDADVYNFSDLIFHLAGIAPIKVRQRRRDPESPMIRLSIRDVFWYCYLDQTHLDSSFFRLEDPFRGRKSQDAMRFFTGLHSDALSEIEAALMRLRDEQQAKRLAVQQIRAFMERFELGSDVDLAGALAEAEAGLARAKDARAALDSSRTVQTHPTDVLRGELRSLSEQVEGIREALSDSHATLSEQKALRAELITTKTKALRATHAAQILDGVHYQRCPECNSDLSTRETPANTCGLCLLPRNVSPRMDSQAAEALRRDLNERIDQIGDSIARKTKAIAALEKQLSAVLLHKASRDQELQVELARYDSAFIEAIRGSERDIATLTERIVALRRLQQMPIAVNSLEREADALQGDIEHLRTSFMQERSRLRQADENIAAIADEFKRLLISISFPGVSAADQVILEPRNWIPSVKHGDQEWTFFEAGSGGKKTLFNVLYALAVHAVALDRGMPVPSLLIIDSPTKNISDDENPELIRGVYAEIFRLARTRSNGGLQFLIVDSDLVEPEYEVAAFSHRRMAGEPGAPRLISYYVGP